MRLFPLIILSLPFVHSLVVPQHEDQSLSSRSEIVSSTRGSVWTDAVLAMVFKRQTGGIEDVGTRSTPTTWLERRDPQNTRPSYSAYQGSDLVCRPFGECEPCPADELNQPFCMPFGNRRLLHCVPASEADIGDGRQTSAEIPAWEACGKVIVQEKHDFLEFVCANLLLLIVALAILWVRGSALAKAQYRQLATRIGFPGSAWTT